MTSTKRSKKGSTQGKFPQHTELESSSDCKIFADKKLAHEPYYLNHIVVRINGRHFLLKTTQIDWVEAEGNYVRIHRGGESSLVRKSISDLEAQLDPKLFIRIHRSFIINLDQVRELQPLFHGDLRVLLYNGTQLTLSRSYRRQFQKVVGATI